jgi:hypothetical protein
MTDNEKYVDVVENIHFHTRDSMKKQLSIRTGLKRKNEIILVFKLFHFSNVKAFIRIFAFAFVGVFEGNNSFINLTQLFGVNSIGLSFNNFEQIMENQPHKEDEVLCN